MSVAKVMELTATSSKSFDDAMQKGIKKAGKSVRNIKGAWIQDQEVVVEEGKIIEYRVSMKLTFVID